MTEDPLITITDMRPLYCVKGIKKHFESTDLDFAHFLQHGYRASEMLGKGFDGQINRVLENMKTRVE